MEIFNSAYKPLFIFGVSILTFWSSAWLGSWFHKRTWSASEDSRDDFTFVVGGILTLLALILGFTFSMAVTRYDQRKDYEEKEANAIATEYLRANQLQPTEASKVHSLLKSYLEQRILFYVTGNEDELRHINARTAQLQADLWAAASNVPGLAPSPTSALLMTGMNEVLSSQAFTQASWRNRIPVSALILVFLISIMCNFLVGYTAHRRSAFLLLVLPIALSISLFMILDIDSPRGGYIRVGPQDLSTLAESLGSQ